MTCAGRGYLDALQWIILAWLGQGQNIAEARRRLVTSGERIEAPTLLQGLQQRCMINRSLLHAEDPPSLNARGYEQGGNAHPEAGKIEIPFANRVVRRNRAPGWSDMVIVSTMLVIGNSQQCVIPAGAIA